MGWIILIGLLNVTWIIGVWSSCLPGQILDPIATWMAGDSHAVPPIEGHIPDWINKPLLTCPRCMASFHGVLWWCLFVREDWLLLPFYCVSLSGVMTAVTILVLNQDQ
jgi:hypothetical protein